jgi:protocatechuate 3,4-dioxygenase beta subunit
MTQPIRPFPRGDRRLDRRLPRRVFLERTLRAGAVGAAALWTPGALAQELTATPTSRSLEGPFYPDVMPLDTDNDLLIVNDSITPAVGEVTHLTGTVTTRAGTPLRNAFVEIWQCDTNQAYRHRNGVRDDMPPDSNFQGYGRFLTNVKGEYYFRTIKPVPYTLGGIGRTPHIHFGISRNGQRIFSSQMLINGHPLNDRDALTSRIEDPLARETILVDFNPLPGSKIGELTARFDIVLGRTVEELDDGTLRWGLGEPPAMGRG